MSQQPQCPFLREVVMLYCDACAKKKLLPRDQVASMGPCASGDYDACPLARELLRGAGGEDGTTDHPVRS